MRYRRDAGQKGYRKGGMQDRWDAGLEATVMEESRKGSMQERRDAGKQGCRRIWMRKGGTQEMRDAKLVFKLH